MVQGPWSIHKSYKKGFLTTKHKITKRVLQRAIISVLLVSSSSLIVTIANSSEIIRIYDGDTFTLNTKEKVRLLQIDTPEISPSECYAVEAKAELEKLLNLPGKLILKTDPKIEAKDRFGRLLRYVFVGDVNINLRMVEIGAAAPYFYKKERGLFADELWKAALNAKVNKIGLWRNCPNSKLKPNYALSTN